MAREFRFFPTELLENIFMFIRPDLGVLKNVCRKWHSVISSYEQRKQNREKNTDKIQIPYHTSPSMWDWYYTQGRPLHVLSSGDVLATYPVLVDHFKRLHSAQYPFDFIRIMKIAIVAHNLPILKYLSDFRASNLEIQFSKKDLIQLEVLAMKHNLLEYIQYEHVRDKLTCDSDVFDVLELHDNMHPLTLTVFEPKEIIKYFKTRSLGRSSIEFIDYYLKYIHPKYLAKHDDIQSAVNHNNANALQIFVNRESFNVWPNFIHIHNILDANIQ